MKCIVLMFCLSLFTNSLALATSAEAKKLKLTTSTSTIAWEEHNSGQFCTVNIIFKGEVSKQDIDAFRKVLDLSCTEAKKNEHGVIKYDLSLDSRGGDVDAALAIGRLMRNAKFPVRDISFVTKVMHEHRCYSACVFILGAGLRRNVYSPDEIVGIHRPYFAQLDQKYSTAEIRQIRSIQNKAIREYLVEMDIAENLLDAMLAVPPDKIKLLTEGELTQFRLNLPDANFEEKTTANHARSWYLTSSEYRERYTQYQAKCMPWPPRPYDQEWHEVCEATVMLRISREEHLRRRERKSECLHLFNDPKYEKNGFPALECMYRIRAGK
jgi:hypothetical protein